jgi:hypothetical protein
MHKTLRIFLGVLTFMLALAWCVVVSVAPVRGPTLEFTSENLLKVILMVGPPAVASVVIVSLVRVRVRLFHGLAFLMIPAFFISLEQVIENPIFGAPLAGYLVLWCWLYYRVAWRKTPS